MNRVLLTALCTASLCLPFAQAQESIIPQPAKLVKDSTLSAMTLNAGTALICESKNPLFTAKSEQLRSDLNKGTGLLFSAAQQPENVIVIREDSTVPGGKEGYTLQTNGKQIILSANAPEGIFYAGQTLKQLFPVEFFGSDIHVKKEVKWTVPGGLNITDAPRFPWRAFMLDEVRHFWGEKTVKQIIDQMALLKMNTLHWHLTDDAGWRIEIKKYPKLTEVGSKRDDTEIITWNSGKSDGFPHQGFYTQDQIRDIVKYAADRNITIVPEIEMPGHAGAAIFAYPHLGLKVPKKVPTTFVVNYAFDPTSESTYEFLSDVLTEVAALFPGKVIHIGGDEVRYNDMWKGEPKIEAFMKTKGLKSFSDVQVYFSNRLSHIVSQKGKRMMGWNEIMGSDVNGDGGGKVSEQLDTHAIIHFWKGGAELAKEAAKKGHEVVSAYHGNTYLDYSYSSISLSKAYLFDPMFQGLEPQYHKNIIGSGCQMWTEWVPNVERLHFQIFPRLCAFAEGDWTPLAVKNFADFKRRMEVQCKRMDLMGIAYAKDQIAAISEADFFNTPKAGAWSPETLKNGNAEWDVTALVTKPGTYKITLFYTRGLCGITISSVALNENGVQIAVDKHDGFSGKDKNKITYTLKVPAVKPGAVYKIKADIKGSGGNDSNGTVYIQAE